MKKKKSILHLCEATFLLLLLILISTLYLLKYLQAPGGSYSPMLHLIQLTLLLVVLTLALTLIQEESADMARRSVAYNHLEDKIKVITGDIRDASNIFGASSFHVITTNPPYMIGTHGENSPSTAKAIARHEVLCTLDDILRESARLLMPGGRFYMVHRPFRLAEIMSKMVEYKIEPKRMRLVYPYIDKEPNMVLIEGLRGGKSRVTVEKPLIVYKEQGVYTDEIYDIYGY